MQFDFDRLLFWSLSVDFHLDRGRRYWIGVQNILECHPLESIQIWGAQRLNRVDMYGTNLIPMVKFGGHWLPGAYAYGHA